MLREFQQVREATDVKAYEAALVRCANEWDFSTISAIMMTERAQEAPQFLSVGNTPDGYADAFNDVVDASRDPVLKRLRTLTMPMVWDQDTYTAGGAGDLWERQAPFGYHTGVAMALHLADGKHFFLGVDRRTPLPTNTQRLNRMLADLQMLAVYAQDSAQRLFEGPARNPPSLSEQERDVLFWLARGKSGLTVSLMLGMTEVELQLHVERAQRKFRVDSLAGAIEAARSFGLL